MLSTEKKFISVLTSDATLNAIVPAANISVGPVDMVIELQSELRMPHINIHLVSENEATVPLGARETQYQLDIWSRTSQLEVETIYERVLTLLSFTSYDSENSHTFWERAQSVVDEYESDMRVFHRAITFQVWAMPT